MRRYVARHLTAWALCRVANRLAMWAIAISGLTTAEPAPIYVAGREYHRSGQDGIRI